MLNFEQFQEYALDHIREFLPEELKDADIRLNSVMKNNGKQLEAINVCAPESNIAPNVYLNGFYKSYEDGADLNTIMKDIADTSAMHQGGKEFGNIARDFMDFEFVKDKIVMALVNADKNRQMLVDTPHVMKEDLAIIYKVIVGMDENDQGIATVTIKEPHLEAWGQDIEMIHNLAMVNTERLLPTVVQSMDEIMLDMMGGADMPEELRDMFLEEKPLDQQMFVITNSEKMNGAAAIIYSSALDQLAEKFGSDVYILPSSVHECIAVSSNMGDPESLAEMVQEVNGTQVEMDEQLSDHVYRFDAQTREITLADTTMEQLQQNASMVSEPVAQYDAPAQSARHCR